MVTVKKTPKIYVPVKLEVSVHKNLKHLQALRELQNEKRPTLSELIEELVESQPTIEVTGKEVLRKRPPL